MPKSTPAGERFPHEFEGFRELADSLPQIVWVTLPDGSHQYYNQQWYDYTGLTLDDSTNAAWCERFHPEDRERAQGAWQQALATGDPYEIEFRLKRSSDDAYRWFLGRALPRRDPAGEIVSWFGTCTDITEQKETQEALRAARDQLRRESIQKDEFLGVVSHELRTPLNAVFGWTRLMQQEVLEEHERAQAVDSIMRNAEAQARLIDDVLDITGMMNQKIALDRQMLNLWHVVTDAFDGMLPAAEAKGVALLSTFESHDLLCHGDRNRLQQVLLNVLGNAVKFTPAGGEIRVGLGEQNGFCAITITDNGQGISPDLLPHIFERFQQGDSSYTRRNGGLGLGLAIAQQLTALHGGKIHAESAGEGKGSHFTILLPILNADTLPASDGRLPCSGNGTFPAEYLRDLHVMVVDDESSVRELLALALTKCGASVTLAASASDALALLEDLRPDVVVSDIAMPGADGYDFIAQLRASMQNDGRHVPAIALTACASGHDRDHAVEAGFNHYLTKPVDPAELVRAIAQTHAAHRAEVGATVAVVA